MRLFVSTETMYVNAIWEENWSTVAPTSEDSVQNSAILPLVCICSLHLYKHRQAKIRHLHKIITRGRQPTKGLGHNQIYNNM